MLKSNGKSRDKKPIEQILTALINPRVTMQVMEQKEFFSLEKTLKPPAQVAFWGGFL